MKKSRWLLIFNLLVVYVFVQFIWWSVLIAGQLRQIYGDTPAYSKKLWMIFGEGFVFLIILLTGVYFVRRALKREIEINQQQKNFLLAVTHELKTPIAISKLSLQTIAGRQLDEARRNEIIAKAIQETDRLNELIDSIMLVVKLDEKNLDIKKVSHNISELITQQVELLQQTIGLKHRTELKIEKDILLNVDPAYFIPIISNLYSNAVKYSPVDSTITIELKREKGKICLQVCDQGSGVNEKDREKIFERFYRSGDENTRVAKGTGLGLFITKHLVQLHGGAISCRNNSPQGAIFQIAF